MVTSADFASLKGEVHGLIDDLHRVEEKVDSLTDAFNEMNLKLVKEVGRFATDQTRQNGEATIIRESLQNDIQVVAQRINTHEEGHVIFDETQRKMKGDLHWNATTLISLGALGISGIVAAAAVFHL